MEYFSYNNIFDELIKTLIRPPRQLYSLENLGPQWMLIDNIPVQRTDFQLINKRNLKIEVSLFKIDDENNLQLNNPCVVYLHGNSSSRVASLDLLPTLIKSGISLCALDFAGSGNSQGEYISLGYFEKDDLDVVVEHLYNHENIQYISLWAYSMGCSTSILYMKNNFENICACVFDSPFSNIKDVSLEIGKKFSGVPEWTLHLLWLFLRDRISEKIGFNIEYLDLSEHIKTVQVPAMFIVGKQDDFIFPYHCEKLYQQYQSQEKEFLNFEGDHTSKRPQYIIQKAVSFLYKKFRKQMILNSKNNINGLNILYKKDPADISTFADEKFYQNRQKVYQNKHHNQITNKNIFKQDLSNFFLNYK